ncbi:MAG: ribose 5-phosphate isomerase B [Anaerolineae bacterium]|nr:ribose 5-phosphate isomerase B [Anaerolineae bacterium]
MRVALASDHAGAALKADLVDYVASLGHEAVDLGADGSCSVDYPDFARAAAEGVADGRYHRAILVCGTGLGMSIAANKVTGIRAALCHECYSARMSREHNDANVLCLGQRVVGTGLARDVARVFLETEFSQGPNHRRRIEQIAAYETGTRSPGGSRP